MYMLRNANASAKNEFFHQWFASTLKVCIAYVNQPKGVRKPMNFWMHNNDQTKIRICIYFVFVKVK